MAFLMSFSVYAEKFALIIAVGDYPKKTGWSSISSANDVPLIKQTLLNQGFKEENIIIIINEQATKKGIEVAIDKLYDRINKDRGDIVVIHYSGHGQQIFDDNDEEIDGNDEAIIPFDAWVKYTHNYQGENHIRDDQLGNIIAKFRNQLGVDGQFLLLLDSCHSGSATRGGKTRGSKAVFAPEGWTPKSNKSSNEGSDMFEKIKVSDHAAPFVLISGASANELNYEYEGFGSLSFAFSKAMGSLGTNFSYNQLFAKIEAEMNIISPKQTPTIEGDIHKQLFKNAYVKQQPYFKVASMPRADVLKIQAGKIHHLFKNTTVNILPASSSEVTEDKIIATGKITSAKFNESIIKLDKPLPDSNEKNYWVFIDKPSYGDIAIDVFFDKNISDKDLINGVSDYLTKNNLGKVVIDSLDADVILLMEENKVTLNSANGLESLDKDIKTRGTNAIDEINKKLFDFAQGQYLKKLSFKNYDYEFEFKLIPIEYDMETDEVGELKPESENQNSNGTFQVIPEIDHVVLQVINKSKKPLYFSIIEINSKGLISPFMPNNNCTLNNNERKIAPGQTMTFKDCIFSFGPPYEKILLKGFATPSPINFQSAVESRGKKIGKRSLTNPLESFLARSYSQSRGSDGNKSSNRIDGYSTEFIYEIVREK